MCKFVSFLSDSQAQSCHRDDFCFLLTSSVIFIYNRSFKKIKCSEFSFHQMFLIWQDIISHVLLRQISLGTVPHISGKSNCPCLFPNKRHTSV